MNDRARGAGDGSRAATRTEAWPLRRFQVNALFALFFASGAAALIYQVLWQRELGRLFGVTAQAAATTLAVFFLGLAAGGFVWGRRAASLRNPLRGYAALEIGIAVTALLYFALLDLFRWIQPSIVATLGDRPFIILGVKFVLAAVVLFPPAFCMGGTLPVMAQYLVRQSNQLGRRTSLLYALNTVGAACGALLAGFVLPRYLGFRGSYVVAIAINVLIAATTFSWSRQPTGQTVPVHPAPEKRRTSASRWSGAVPLVWVVAALSGFLALSLEVLWTRMYAQVLQNSVYTFAAILTVFLTSLALGAALANQLCHRAWRPQLVLSVLLTACGLLVGLTPLWFQRVTSGLEVVGTGLGWGSYIVHVFGLVAAVLFLPTLAMGSIFPYLMKLSEARMESAGKTVGSLTAINTLAAIAGSITAGFILLDVIGLWASVHLMGAGYLALGFFAAPTGGSMRRWRAAPITAAVLLGCAALLGDYADAYVDLEQDEVLVEVWEGSHGTVAMVRRGHDRRIKVNNSYLVGTSHSTVNLRLQSQIPLAMHGNARSVFYLGMGTGITAGGALDFPVERVVICELNEDVVRAGRKYFDRFAGGLYEDPRVEIRIDDGRTHLAVTADTYDLIIADIFLTYKAGSGNLYTREHFETVRSRLAPGGAFVQWLTMFDLSEEEFGIIARTMIEVFPQVSLWRRGFSPRFPIYALVGQNTARPVDYQLLMEQLEHLEQQGKLHAETWVRNIPMAAYAGNVTQARSLFEAYAISTDDRTPLEYLTPITERNSKGDRSTGALAWLELGELCERLLESSPPEQDPLLTGADETVRQVRAGLAYYHYETHKRLDHETEASDYLREYRRWLAGDSAGP